MLALEIAEQTAAEKIARLQAEANAGWWEGLWIEAVKIWGNGGWAMWAIAVIALLIFGMGIHIWLGLRAVGFTKVPERKWRWWIEHPRERTGPIGRMLDFVTGGRTAKDTAFFFHQLRSTELPPFERDLKIVKTAVAAAPLVGLLGTVTGMLATFGALSTGSGGDQTMEKIAEGISEALITTETGLVVALPGVFFQYQLTRTYERYAAFLAISSRSVPRPCTAVPERSASGGCVTQPWTSSARSSRRARAEPRYPRIRNSNHGTLHRRRGGRQQ